MFVYVKLWQFMATTDPGTGKRHKLAELYDDPTNPDRHEPIGISKPTIDRMRRGEAVSMETIDKICGRLGLQPGDMLEWLPGEQPEYQRPDRIEE
jgi:DNA-binding Xre family transcriptional regulator